MRGRKDDEGRGLHDLQRLYVHTNSPSFDRRGRRGHRRGEREGAVVVVVAPAGDGRTAHSISTQCRLAEDDEGGVAPPPSFLKTEHATQYFSGRRRGRQCLTLPHLPFFEEKLHAKDSLIQLFPGDGEREERTKISAVTHFSAPSSEKAARIGKFMDGDGKEGRLAACNNTVLAKLQVCRETLRSFPLPWLDPHPLVWKGTRTLGGPCKTAAWVTADTHQEVVLHPSTSSGVGAKAGADSDTATHMRCYTHSPSSSSTWS